MASGSEKQPSAAETQQQRNLGQAGTDRQRDVVVTGRPLGQAPAPEHGDPTEQQPAPLGGSVIGVRVGSEAAVEEGTGPVLPAAGAGSEFTKVRNRDLRERDEKEFRKRGQRGGRGSNTSLGRSISISFEGPVIIEREEEEGGDQFVNGSFTGVLPEGGLRVRALTSEEEEKYFGAPVADRSQRANDLVKGSGTGGGGNPMHAGRTRGTSSTTAERVGQGGVTSQAGASPGPRPANAGETSPDRNR